ncbi:MAG: hypothetical protein ABFD54_12965 [Armatimonadota bacterium]|nr:hypothetical protein [bacterium]
MSISFFHCVVSMGKFDAARIDIYGGPTDAQNIPCRTPRWAPTLALLVMLRDEPFFITRGQAHHG